MLTERSVILSDTSFLPQKTCERSIINVDAQRWDGPSSHHRLGTLSLLSANPIWPDALRF